MNGPELTPAERRNFHEMLRRGATTISRRRRLRAQTFAVSFAAVVVAAITVAAIGTAQLTQSSTVATTPTGTALPTPPSTPTPAPTPTSTAPEHGVATSPPPTTSPPDGGNPPSSEEPEPVTFTYRCFTPESGELEGEFASWEEVWAMPTVTSCEPFKHGSVVTPEQEAAIDLALPAYAGDREEALVGLHAQCAITDNGYLSIDPLSGNQIYEVEGMLALCPDRPGADTLAAALPTH